MIELNKEVEKVLAVSFLNEAAGKGTAMVDTFSSWMVGGHGVAVMVLLSQYDSAIKHIYAHSILVFLNQFIVSLFLVIVQKYLSLIISSGSNGGQIAWDQFSRFEFDRKAFELDKFNAEIDLALLKSTRWLVRRNRKKDTDFAAPSRRAFKKFQLQCSLVLLQALLLLFAVFELGRAFHP